MSAGLDLTALLAVLERDDVRYIVVGSVAAAAHGAPGVEPGDLDIVPAIDSANLGRLAAAIESMGAQRQPEFGEWVLDETGEREWVEDGRERPIRPLDPADPSSFDHSFSTPHGRLDVVPEAAGSYADLRERAIRRPLAGQRPLVAAAPDLLAMLTRPRRAKDVPRVRYLRSIRSSSGIGFVGFRTDRFEEMVALFRDRIGLGVIHQSASATWFQLGDDAELHVYSTRTPTMRSSPSGRWSGCGWTTSPPPAEPSRPMDWRCSPGSNAPNGPPGATFGRPTAR